MTVSESRERPSWLRPLFPIMLVGALVVAALPTLLYPLARDQGMYAYQADVMMHGGALFRDAWELKGPGVQFAYWLAFWLFGRSEFALRLFDVLYTLLSAALVYALAWEVFQDGRIAACSAWLYAFCYYALVSFFATAHSEAFMMPFLVGSVYGVVRGVGHRSSRALLLGGAASGFVFWFKPPAGLVTLAALLWACYRMREEHRGMRGMVRSLAIFTLGGALGLLPFGLYLYGRGLAELVGIWRAYGGGSYLETGGLALGDGPLAKLDVVLHYLEDWQLLVWLALAGVLSTLAGRRRNHAGEAVVIFLLSTAGVALVQGKLFEYHWIPVLAPLAVLAAVALTGLAREIGGLAGMALSSIRNNFTVVAIVGLSLWLAFNQLPRYRRMVAYATGQIGANQFYAQFDLGKDYSHMGALRAATYLREHTAPHETAFIWGAESLVHFLAERRSPTRYTYFHGLLDGEASVAAIETCRQELMTDLSRTPPLYIVLVENDVTPLAPLGSLAYLHEIPALKALLETEYQYEAQVEDYLFYRRRDGRTAIWRKPAETPICRPGSRIC